MVPTLAIVMNFEQKVALGTSMAGILLIVKPDKLRMYLIIFYDTQLCFQRLYLVLLCTFSKEQCCCDKQSHLVQGASLGRFLVETLVLMLMTPT